MTDSLAPQTVRVPVAQIGQRVLLAEDNAKHRDAISSALLDHGHDVVEVDDGYEILACLRIIAENNLRVPCAIVMSVGERFLGVALTETIRDLGWSTPIILTATSGVSDLKRRVAHVPATTVLPKPVSLDTLLSCFSSHAPSDLVAER